MHSHNLPYDCIIIGAGPGGLQAAIHLARYNRRVLLLDRGGGRTRHASELENYLGHERISGRRLIDIGLAQVRHFGVSIKKTVVRKLGKSAGLFSVRCKPDVYTAPYVIASSGAGESLPQIKNLSRFFSKSFYTCVDCDGFRTTGKQLLLMGNSMHAVRLAFAMRQMYTKDVTLLACGYRVPDDVAQLLREDSITLRTGEPAELLGREYLNGVRLKDGTMIACQAVMASFGMRLHDSYLSGLELQRDQDGFKILVNADNESSLDGLYVLGALRQGHSQAIIAAGQGATAAIDINRRLLDL
jgi:thioredoxin reductase (NADPH)